MFHWSCSRCIKNMIQRPPFYSGFHTDHIEHGLQGAMMLKLIMEGERLDSTSSQIIIPLEFFEGRTLKKMNPVRGAVSAAAL